MNWLILAEVLQRIEDARVAQVAFTPEQVSAFTLTARNGDERVLAVAGDVAEIHVRGTLTNARDMFAEWFGGGNTTYPEINDAIAKAEADVSVTRIDFRFDSGGGEVSGLFDTCDAIAGCSKPTRAVVATMAASAAYAMASQADTVVAVGRASCLGGVGVAVRGRIDHELQVTLTSTNAPDKRPDLTTAAGKATVVAELDEVAALLDECIASGRGTTVANVNKNYGAGGTMLAARALENGLIDSINANGPGVTGKTKKEATMTPSELRAAHPDTYATIRAEGTAEGAQAENDRINAHLIMGAASGDMKTAMAAAADGSEMTATLRATYDAASMNRRDLAARTGDEDDLGGAGDDLGGATAKTPEELTAYEASVFNLARGGVDEEGAL